MAIILSMLFQISFSCRTREILKIIGNHALVHIDFCCMLGQAMKKHLFLDELLL